MCIQPCIPFTYIPFGVFVLTYNQQVLVFLDEEVRGLKISTFLQIHIIFISQWHHLGDIVTFIDLFYYLVSTPLGCFSLRVTRFIRCIGLIIPNSKLNHLCYCLLFKIILLRHIYVGYTNIYFCECFKPSILLIVPMLFLIQSSDLV